MLHATLDSGIAYHPSKLLLTTIDSLPDPETFVALEQIITTSVTPLSPSVAAIPIAFSKTVNPEYLTQFYEHFRD